MDMGRLSLALKMISEEYKLSDAEISILSHRMMADDVEFERIWELYKNKARKFSGGVDRFKELLLELLR